MPSVDAKFSKAVAKRLRRMPVDGGLLGGMTPGQLGKKLLDAAPLGVTINLDMIESTLVKKKGLDQSYFATVQRERKRRAHWYTRVVEAMERRVQCKRRLRSGTDKQLEDAVKRLRKGPWTAGSTRSSMRSSNDEGMELLQNKEDKKEEEEEEEDKKEEEDDQGKKKFTVDDLLREENRPGLKMVVRNRIRACIRAGLHQRPYFTPGDYKEITGTKLKAGIYKYRPEKSLQYSYTPGRFDKNGKFVSKIVCAVGPPSFTWFVPLGSGRYRFHPLAADLKVGAGGKLIK